MRLQDLFHHEPKWNILICIECKSMLQTSAIRHVQLHHGPIRQYNPAAIRALENTFLPLSVLQAPESIRQTVKPLPDAEPIRHLPVFRDGICCLLCPDDAERYVCRGRTALMTHLKTAHGYTRGRPAGRIRGGVPGGVEGLALEGIVRFPVTCQAVFHKTPHCRYFVVDDGKDQERAEKQAFVMSLDGIAGLEGGSLVGASSRLRGMIELELEHEDTIEAAAAARAAAPSGVCLQDARIRSPWLQMTEWPRFLAPFEQRLADVAELLAIPSRDNPKPVLSALLCALDRIVARARVSLEQGKLNPFDQHRLNSFIPNRSSRKPFFHRLREETYKRYTQVFTQLLCYVYNLAWKKEGPTIPFRLTDGQAIALTEAVRTAAETIEAASEGYARDALNELEMKLDDRCLVLLVSLLDQKLYGDIYDSIVVGFLAALGIRNPMCAGGQAGSSPKVQWLCDANEYTPKLSALIKLGQLFVAERALLAVERDEADVPARALEEMHGRFMTIDARSPVSWALKLRAYGKAIKDSTTSLGQISWSDDGQMLSYKKMRFSMAQLRSLVATELERAQALLEELLLVPPDMNREDIVPTLGLRSLIDDPSEGRPGWSFIDHPRNEMLHGHQKWLLNRVLHERSLRVDFFADERTAKWRPSTIARYLATAEGFLELLLLLVHITGGQPARGTELLCIQHRNPTDSFGGRRNIFFENGLVSFVTYYHKGYSITGSIKIIHRYLPSEVGELLVYYVWLVVPFLNQLSKLARLPGFTKGETPYIWGGYTIAPAVILAGNDGRNQARPCAETKKVLRRAEKKQAKRSRRITSPLQGPSHIDRPACQPWLSKRLSTVITRAFKQHIGTEANIQTWRHAAIAISRRHLQQAKFKRDFIEAISWAWNDEMAAHSTKMAGLTYARGLDEAPGHIASAKEEYRRISREWHSWLGFGIIRT